MNRKLGCNVKISDVTKITVSILSFLEENISFIGKDFIDYMNQNDLWVLLDDSGLLKGLMCSDLNEILDFFGTGLSEDEKNTIMSRYYG